MRVDPIVRVRIATLGGDRMGLWDEDTRTVWLDASLSAVERRCTLAHELVHAERGDVPCGDPVLDCRQERRVERITAARLIGVAELADALRWSQQPGEVAGILGVDHELLRVRLESLSPGEELLLHAALTSESSVDSVA